MMPDSDVLLTAIRAALAAGSAIMEVYSNPIAVTLKADASPLTLADEKANTIITAFLESTGIPIISEEHKLLDYNTRNTWQRCWMVDPLDGTKEFIKRNGEFTVNIALIEAQKPVLGVIYVPDSKTLYFADVPSGAAYKMVLESHAYYEGIVADATPIHPQPIDAKGVKVVGSRSHASAATDAFIASLETTHKTITMVVKGSSLKFCLLAEGLAHVYPRFAPTMEWDTAAGHAICNAVGIRVRQVDSPNELQYNKADLLNPYFIAQ